MTINIDQVYSSNGGKKILLSKKNIWGEIEKTFTNSKLSLQKGETTYLKRQISNNLNKLGWSDDITIEPTKLTINFIKKRVGLCFQLGNVARIYADLLKIQTLYQKKIIDSGVLIVPMKKESRTLGSNHAQYERIVDEMKLFEEIIDLPLLIIGVN
jgi:hypothetical protein